MAKREIYGYDDDGEACYPIAHMALDSADEPTYEADLDWYFNEYDSECGLRSIGLSGMEAAFDSNGNRHKWSDGSGETVHIKGGHGGEPVNDPWSDGRHLDSFRRGRSIWRRFVQLSPLHQAKIKAFYTPRYPLEKDQDWGAPIPDRKTIIEAVSAFREVRL